MTSRQDAWGKGSMPSSMKDALERSMRRAAGALGGTALSRMALVLLVLAFGLPWAIIGDRTDWISGWYVGSSCTVDGDGFIWCTPSYASPGYAVDGQGALGPGYQSPVRLLLAAAIVLVLLAAKTETRKLLAVAAVLLVIGVFMYGTAMQAGTLSALAAAGMLGLQAIGKLPMGPVVRTETADPQSVSARA
ncbi:hypothetical protein [Humidisolicoccus flavus]|uniref:hypothetical protein n=1 Tax=Humidisolicoccus flavus TaxID=3111414 RepID=UPI00324CEE8B